MLSISNGMLLTWYDKSLPFAVSPVGNRNKMCFFFCDSADSLTCDAEVTSISGYKRKLKAE